MSNYAKYKSKYLAIKKHGSILNYIANIKKRIKNCPIKDTIYIPTIGNTNIYECDNNTLGDLVDVKKQPILNINYAIFYDCLTLTDLYNYLKYNIRTLENVYVRNLIFTSKLANYDGLPNFPKLYDYFIIKSENTNNLAFNMTIIKAIIKITKSAYNIDYTYEQINSMGTNEEISLVLENLEDIDNINKNVKNIYNLYIYYGRVRLFMFVEYLHNTLENYFYKNRNGSIKEILNILLQIFMALYYLKNVNKYISYISNFVHCDLHFLNIMYNIEKKTIKYDYNGTIYTLKAEKVIKIIDRVKKNSEELVTNEKIYNDYTQVLEVLFNKAYISENVINSIISIINKDFTITYNIQASGSKYYFISIKEENDSFINTILQECKKLGILLNL